MPASTDKECRSVCPVANALDIVGDRWTLVVIRDMMLFGRHEFHEFMDAGEGISTNILTDRLKRLTEEGVARMVPHATNKTRKLYYLTQKGKDLLPLMLEMSFWGGEHHSGSAPAKPKIHEVKKNKKQFMQQTLKQMRAWEKENLHCSSECEEDTAPKKH